jgi:hypothetical protein
MLVERLAARVPTLSGSLNTQNTVGVWCARNTTAICLGDRGRLRSRSSWREEVARRDCDLGEASVPTLSW